MELREGERIFYHGDMANAEDFGTVTKRYNDKWGRFVDVVLDDGRKIHGLHLIAFSETYLGHGGTRFVTEAEYDRWRTERMVSHA